MRYKSVFINSKWHVWCGMYARWNEDPIVSLNNLYFHFILKFEEFALCECKYRNIWSDCKYSEFKSFKGRRFVKVNHITNDSQMRIDHLICLKENMVLVFYNYKEENPYAGVFSLKSIRTYYYHLFSNIIGLTVITRMKHLASMKGFCIGRNNMTNFDITLFFSV